ncbi:GTPase activating protein (GAP), partial [Teratosphaeriaceae sp. CCFEE 6253]
MDAEGHAGLMAPAGAGAGGVVGPGKGLRGVLDNIVTDGMRVAAEVRRRMDEAQRELDRGASVRGTEEDEDEEEGEEMPGDLLEGAEADAGAGSVRSGISREGSLMEEGESSLGGGGDAGGAGFER